MSEKDPAYFYIKSVNYGDFFLDGGDQRDGNVYLRRNAQGRDQAQWCFEPYDASKNIYQIRNKAFGNYYLVSKEKDDGRAHLDLHKERSITRWKLEYKTIDNESGMSFTDGFHGFTLASPYSIDGHVYIQDLNNPSLTTHPNLGNTPINRKCMLWTLEPVQELAGNMDIPDFYIVGEGTTTFEKGQIEEGKKESFCLVKGTVRDETKAGGSQAVPFSESFSRDYFVEFDTEVSSEVCEEFGWKIGAQFGLDVPKPLDGKISGEVSKTTTREMKTKNTSTRRHSYTETTQYSVNTEYEVKPYTSFDVSVMVDLIQTKIPFTITTTFPLIDGTTLTKTITGTWHGPHAIGVSLVMDNEKDLTPES